jgi:hypothetical protein
MTPKSTFRPIDYGIGVVVVAGAALVLGVVLSALSSPARFDERVAAIDVKVERSKALLRPPRDRGPYGPEALCVRQAGEQAQTLRELVSTQAARNSLEMVSLDVRPEPAPDLSERLVPVRIRFAAVGTYENTVALMAVLARERPEVFVDSLDLTPRVSNVTLAFSGRVFCAA